MIFISIDFTREMKPLYIDSIEANQLYMYTKSKNAKVIFKIRDEKVEFKEMKKHKAVLNDSLFLRFMRKSITRNSGDTTKDFIVIRFNYDAECTVNEEPANILSSDLRMWCYTDGVSVTYNKKDKKTNTVKYYDIHYKMLMRSPGKAKESECIFIRDSLHHKAINFLTMGLYDIMSDEAKKNPDAVFKIVELSAYQTLTTATAIKYISIPLKNMLILKDEKVSVEKNAYTVTYGDIDTKYVKDFQAFEEILNPKGFTTYKRIAKKNPEYKYLKRNAEEFAVHGLNINLCPYKKMRIKSGKKTMGCSCKEAVAKIENTLFDGMGIIDESIFPEKMNGFIYCRSQFYKACLFRGNIQEFFKDYCNENNLDYENATMEAVDLFERKLKLSDIKVIITDTSIKWFKFMDYMGENKKKAFKYYDERMKEIDYQFSIVKTAHKSKWNDLQLMAYQMSNSLPTTDEERLASVTECSVNMLNNMKMSDDEYLRYLEISKNRFNINELLLALVERNPLFAKTEFFRKKKSRDLYDLKEELEEGRLFQNGDNLTVMDNPVALLLKAVGENPLQENCFELVEDGVQCYTTRFAEGERLAAFRNPHNAANNILHLYNVYPDKLLKYFPNIGENVLVLNAIKTDTQARMSGHDCDTDFFYTTNQKELADLAREAYINYPTIINEIKESGSSMYHFTNEDFAVMDTRIAEAQVSIGTSTDTAQLALSYYYHGGMQNEELKKCFIILSVIAQISIDLAKKTFDIDVVKEIDRLKHLPYMKGQGIPQFFAKTKKSRNNKEYDEAEIIEMNCPMDIMMKIIEKSVIKYAKRESHLPFRDFLNREIKPSCKSYEQNKIKEACRNFNEHVAKLESMRDKLSEEKIYELKNYYMRIFCDKIKFRIDQEAMMKLIVEAVKDENSDIRTTLLNFLFQNNREIFLSCFVKNDLKICEKFSYITQE